MLLHRHVRDSAIKNGNWVVIQLNYNYSTLPSNYGTWMESSIFFLLCNRIKYTWEKKKEMESDESYKVKQSEKVRDLEKKKLNFFLFSRVSAHECFKSFCRLPRRGRSCKPINLFLWHEKEKNLNDLFQKCGVVT